MAIQNNPCLFCNNRTFQEKLIRLVSDSVPVAISGFTLAGPVGAAGSIILLSLDNFFFGSQCAACSSDLSGSYNFSRSVTPFLIGVVTGSVKGDSISQLSAYVLKSGVPTIAYDFALLSFTGNPLATPKAWHIACSTLVSCWANDNVLEFFGLK